MARRGIINPSRKPRGARQNDVVVCRLGLGLGHQIEAELQQLLNDTMCGRLLRTALATR